MADPARGGGIHDEDALGKAYDGRLIRRLAAYVRPYWPLVAGAIVCLFFEGAMQLVGPILTERVIDVALPYHDTGTDPDGRPPLRRLAVRAVHLLLRRDDSHRGTRPARDARSPRADVRASRTPADRVLRPQSGRTSGHPRDRRHRGAQRAVHRRRRLRTRRPLHASRDRGGDAGRRLAARGRRRSA